MKNRYSFFKNFSSGLSTLILSVILMMTFQLPAVAQDYMINRGVFAASYTGGLRMCVVDKNEFYQPYTLSGHCAVRQ